MTKVMVTCSLLYPKDFRDYYYDNNGNLGWEELTIDGKTYHLDYAYNSLDALSSITYPSQGEVGTVTYSPDVLSRPQNITAAGQTVVNSISWHPSGVPNTINYANGQSVTQTLTDRLQIDEIDLPYVGTVDYNYHDNGNVSSINNLPGGSITNMQYDPMQRLTSLTGPWGTGSIGYDKVGNITSKVMGSETVSYNYDYSTNKLDTATVSNSGYVTNMSMQYDRYGNIKDDGTFSYKYDHAGNMPQLNGNSSYIYDGNGKRVKKSLSGSADAYFFYAANGNLIGEYRADGSSVEYINLGNKTLVQVESKFELQLPATATGGSVDTDGNVTLSWEGDPSATTYEVQISQDPNFVSGVQTAYSGTATQAEITGLTDGSWYIRIRGCSGGTCDNWYVAEEPLRVERKFIPIAVGDITIIIPMKD